MASSQSLHASLVGNICANMKNPNKIILTIYGVLSLSFIIAIFWIVSFSWTAFISTDVKIAFIFILLLAGLICFSYIDKVSKTKTKKYFIVSLIQFLIIWIFANQVRTWQIETSLKKGNLIIETLEKYKNNFGKYPDTFSQLDKDLNCETPRRTNVGTRFNLNKFELDDYSISFKSYYGYFYFYNSRQKQWFKRD
jgi:hypothetical protein